MSDDDGAPGLIEPPAIKPFGENLSLELPEQDAQEGSQRSQAEDCR